MKTIIEAKSGLHFDLDELAAINIYKLKVIIWLKGNGEFVAGEFADKASAQAYRDELVKVWIGDDEADDLH